MASTIAVQFLGDTRSLDRAFSKVQADTVKTESRFSKFKSFAGPALFGGAIAGVALFKDALGGLRAEAEATRTLETTLTSMGRTEISTDNIAKFASKLQANSDFVEEEILAAAGVMATFGNIADRDLNKANQAAADLAARFNMDLGSATVMLGKALNDPIAGLTSLGRAGVQFTKDQKDQIATMVQAGDTAGAQALILGELAKQTEGAAAAQQDSFEKLQDTVGETAESLLSKAMPAIEELVGWINSSVEAFDRVPGSTKAVVVGIGGVTAALWVLHAHPIVSAITVLIGTLVYLEDRFGFVTKAMDFMGGAWDKWKDIGYRAIQSTMDNFLGFVSFILGAAERAFGWIPGIGDKLRTAQGQINAFRDSTNAALEGIRNKEVTVKIMREVTERRRDEAWAGRFGDGPGGPFAPRGGTALSRVRSIIGAYPGLRVTSTYRSPAANRAAGGSPTSYHLDARNPAVDIGGPTYQLDRFHAALGGGWREKLWRVKGHFDHVHVAHQGGMVEPSWPTLPWLGSDERPAILQLGEQVVPRGGGGGQAIPIVINLDGREIARVVARHNDRAKRFGAMA
ncbi:MAG TPA: D-Ala-D-Ala carboxypeptidase family metallohydrolase [Acidimicrobiales bacterium]|nr:D-Ala-D-Ala carboxypeptidase family metallohydrolase [Acidimicrobiales bacterium]